MTSSVCRQNRSVNKKIKDGMGNGLVNGISPQAMKYMNELLMQRIIEQENKISTARQIVDSLKVEYDKLKEAHLKLVAEIGGGPHQEPPQAAVSTPVDVCAPLAEPLTEPLTEPLAE
jgi:hypothetical protein